MTKVAQLRERLRGGEFLKFAGVFDALSARIAEDSGFDGVWISGYGVSASAFAKPDIGLTTLTEMADRARSIARAVDIPVVVDGEVGYGNAINVMRTVEEFHSAGVVGMQLGDESNETCPYLGLPTKILSKDEAVMKIQAAKTRLRELSDFLLFAAPQQGIDRAQAYLDAGADGILYPWENLLGKTPDKETATILGELVEAGGVPVAVTAPFLPAVELGQLRDLGFRMVVLAVEGLYAAAKAQRDLWRAVMKTGTTANLEDFMYTRQEEFMPLLRDEEVRNEARRFLPGSYEEIGDRKYFAV